MELAEALPILQRWYAPGYVNFTISDDHICRREHPPGECPYSNSAKYTALDAALETPTALQRRLLDGGPLKPTQPWPLFFTHIRAAVRTIRGSFR